MEWYELLEVIRNTTERKGLIALIPEVQKFKNDHICTLIMLERALVEQFLMCGYRFSKSFNYTVIRGA
jgi:hypothetical protein